MIAHHYAETTTAFHPAATTIACHPDVMIFVAAPLHHRDTVMRDREYQEAEIATEVGHDLLRQEERIFLATTCSEGSQ